MRVELLPGMTNGCGSRSSATLGRRWSCCAA
jgi:hypothetical protein